MLQGLVPLPDPRPQLEQYTTPAPLAADMLFTALARGDIQERTVCDLGCGNGILAIGASLLGASRVVGVDVDQRALDVAKGNTDLLEVDLDLVLSDVSDFEGSFDTVVQNPPFGAQKRGADRPFLKKALEIGRCAYSLHIRETEPFLVRTVEALGGRIEYRKYYKFNIPHMFGFHSKNEKSVDIVLLLIRR